MTSPRFMKSGLRPGLLTPLQPALPTVVSLGSGLRSPCGSSILTMQLLASLSPSSSWIFSKLLCYWKLGSGCSPQDWPTKSRVKVIRQRKWLFKKLAHWTKRGNPVSVFLSGKLMDGGLWGGSWVFPGQWTSPCSQKSRWFTPYPDHEMFFSFRKPQESLFLWVSPATN
jgi:hypothetical protein